MTSDKKPPTAVLATLSSDGEHWRLFLHDAASDPGGKTWSAQSLFTHTDFESSAFLSGQLSEKQLAEIGFNLVTRLAALAKA